MRIKEVEQATGLTAKAIRMYESKGLLTVAREAENAYRDYTDEDVARLKTIAILRRLDIPVKEIKQWCDGEVKLEDLIRRASYEARTAQEEQKAKAALTDELLEILEENKDTDLPQAIEDAEELQKLYQELDDLLEETRGNLFWPIWRTLVWSGPIFWSVLFVLDGETRKALWGMAVSLLAIPWICYNWFTYFRVPKLKRIKADTWRLVIFVVTVVPLAIINLLFMADFQQRFLIPEGFLSVNREPWFFIAILWPVVQTMLLMEPKEESKRKKLGLRGVLCLLALNLAILYCGIISITTYSNGTFLRRTIFNPAGREYAMSDITEVKTGFRNGWEGCFLWRSKGDFYYKVTFADGTGEDFSDLNSEDEGPWELLLDFDREVMASGAVKISDWEHRDSFDLDNECLAICDEILNNLSP